MPPIHSYADLLRKNTVLVMEHVVLLQKPRIQKSGADKIMHKASPAIALSPPSSHIPSHSSSEAMAPSARRPDFDTVSPINQRTARNQALGMDVRDLGCKRLQKGGVDGQRHFSKNVSPRLTIPRFQLKAVARFGISREMSLHLQS